MDDRIQAIIRNIRLLQNELLAELDKKKQEFLYEIQEKRVRFNREVKERHRQLSIGVIKYILEAPLKHILTAPIVWSCLIPALLMDLMVSLYQWVCFPVYGIPRVVRSEYIILDRQYLSYLNLVEKLNCVFCGYFTGVISYVQEVAARTEQFWCPIKHARKVGAFHGRYEQFFDFGDAVSYHNSLKTVRRKFDDVNGGVNGDAEMNAQNQKEYDEISQKLLIKRDELHRRVESIGKEVRHEQGPVSADFAEQAVECENDEVLDALGREARSELQQVDAALERMEKNEYGVCLECGVAIPLKRLHAMPYADHCVTCAEGKE